MLGLESLDNWKNDKKCWHQQKLKNKKFFFYILENYLLKEISMQSFRFILLVNKKLTFAGGGGE